MNHLARGERLAGMVHRPRPLLAFLSIWLLASVAAATDADDLCNPTDDPCQVTGPVVATPDSIIDVGQRELQILGSGEISVQGGDLTLRGRRIVTGVGTLLRTSGQTRADPGGDLEMVADEVVLTGDLDVRGSPAGAIDITASQSLTISGEIRGRSEAADESASSTSLNGGVVLLTGEIDLDGGREDAGGDLTITGDDVTISGTLAVEGGDGGTVEISATESLILMSATDISARATTAAGDGGDITLASDGVVEVRGTVDASGRDGGEEGGGDGGQLTVTGDLGVTVSDLATVIEALGGSPDGLAGDIEISSLFGSVAIAGSVDAGSEERDGVGGSIDVAADTTIVISGILTARGALGGSGDISVEGEQAVTLVAGSLVDASASRESTAGSVSITSSSILTVNGTILAETPASDAGGGAVTLEGCEITIGGNGELRSTGSQAINALTALGPIVVRGTVIADPVSGENQFRYPDEVPAPDTAGATIQPPPTLIPDTRLTPCIPVPATPTPTITPRPSATPTPGPCAGDCDGDGMVSIAELIRAVNIALGNDDVDNCAAADSNGDGEVAINELIRAVNSALHGCGS